MNFKVKLTLTLLLVATLMTTTLAMNNLGRHVMGGTTFNADDGLSWAGSRIVFQADGNLVFYSGSQACKGKNVVWASNTSNNSGASLKF
jgi:hypothetical protein